MTRCIIIFAFCSIFASCASLSPREENNKLSWQTWSEKVFQQAKREDKLVLLNLGAVWCHWCHVMKEKTYRDRKVIALLNEHYIPIYVDQDARPDLANRYERYGWPATIVFNGEGKEITKRRGYIPPDKMITLLTQLKDNPDSENNSEETIRYTNPPSLPKPLWKEVYQKYLDTYDEKAGSWGRRNKFLDWDGVEYAQARAISGDKQGERMARQTLDAQLALIDPVWGGVYQYSADGRWDKPHFEKIMSVQTENMYIYSWAYALWGEDKYLQAALDVYRYLSTFLKSPQGAFYTSQDADLEQGKHSGDYFALSDTERRKRGIPRIDTHIYARENGWVIRALVSLYCVTEKKQYLNEAIATARWIIANRSLGEGGFRHDEKDNSGPYLADTLAMARGFLHLYIATGEKEWLKRAQQAAAFITENFKYDSLEKKGQGAGFMVVRPSETAMGIFRQPTLNLDENVMVARFFNLLHHYSDDATHREMAEHCMRYLANPEVIEKERTWVGGILLADWELSNPPAHIVVIGNKDDRKAQSLFAGGLKYPSGYKEIEWLDKRETDLSQQKIPFPDLGRAAAFICSQNSCSRPIFEAKEIVEFATSP